MKDYQVEIVRRGTVLIKAASAEEAVAMAGRFCYHQVICWDDNFDIRAAVVRGATNQKAKSDAGGSEVYGTKGCKGGKRRKVKKGKQCQWDSDIPF